MIDWLGSAPIIQGKSTHTYRELKGEGKPEEGGRSINLVFSLFIYHKGLASNLEGAFFLSLLLSYFGMYFFDFEILRGVCGDLSGGLREVQGVHLRRWEGRVRR